MDLFWVSFLKYTAGRSTCGEIRSLAGAEAAWVNSTLIINNGTYLSALAANEDAFRAALAAASDDAKTRELPWAFYLYEPFASGIPAERVTAVAAEFGLARTMGIEVMTGDVKQLRPPARPLPDVEFRRVTTPEDAKTVFDINLRCYGMPLSMGESALATHAYFSDLRREIGFLAYSGGVPVSTATALEIDGWLYVALVATDPDHRQKGYAEAVMRHALQIAAAEHGISRTSLDASAMGAPLYKQMGYDFTGSAWSMYAPA